MNIDGVIYMSKGTLLPADIYTVINKTILNDIDRKTLTMLYQPIIGQAPISLYFTLWTDLDKTEIMSIDFTHHHLMASMQLKLSDIEKAREKLEAMGLLKSYFKKGDINNYIYQLYSPLNSSEFLNDPILNVLLYSNVGSTEYNRIVNYFKIPKINLVDFEDITTSFSEVFQTNHGNLPESHSETIKSKISNNINIEELVDFDLIISSIPKNILNARAFDSRTKTLINKLAFLYGLDNLYMTNIVRGCLNDKGCIDKTKLRKACRNHYQFENSDNLPKLIYRSQPEHLRKDISNNSKRSEIINKFETLSPYEFLTARYNNSNPTNRDKLLIETLMVEQELNAGVVNVLIDYVLKINNNKLNRNFIETIAGHWKRSNIKTVAEAMGQAEKEHKKYKKKATDIPVRAKKEEKLPDWFGQQIDEDKLSDDEENKLKAMLKEFS